MPGDLACCRTAPLHLQAGTWGASPANAAPSPRPAASSGSPGEDRATVAPCHTPSCASPCLQTAQPGQWVFASGDTRDGDRFGVTVGGAPACAQVVRACQVAGAGWEQARSVCMVPCAVLRAHSSPREAPALLQCLHPRVSGSIGAGPQNCSGAGTGLGCQLAQGSRGHRPFLAGEGDEQDPQ